MSKSTKVGAILYGLWGVVHIIGGASLLASVLGTGATEFLENFGGANGTVVSETAEALFAFHAFNITWIGLVVLLTAIKQNWNNSASGYWHNMALAGFSDIGLLIFMIIPGYISIAEGMIGISLFVGALIATTISIKSTSIAAK